jgi:hypothetical protein
VTELLTACLATAVLFVGFGLLARRAAGCSGAADCTRRDPHLGCGGCSVSGPKRESSDEPEPTRATHA